MGLPINASSIEATSLTEIGLIVSPDDILGYKHQLDLKQNFVYLQISDCMQLTAHLNHIYI